MQWCVKYANDENIKEDTLANDGIHWSKITNHKCVTIEVIMSTYKPCMQKCVHECEMIFFPASWHWMKNLYFAKNTQYTLKIVNISISIATLWKLCSIRLANSRERWCK